MPSIEIHIPVGPSPDFLLRVHYLAASIAMYSGFPEGSYKIVVTVGNDERVDLDALCPWARLYPLEWRWVPEDEWKERGIFATAYTRFRYPFDCDAVVMLDADLLVTGSLMDIVATVAGTLRFHAIPAPYSPFFCDPPCLEVRSPEAWWAAVFAAAGLASPPLAMEHLAWPWVKTQSSPYLEQMRFSPPYVNAGVIIGSAEMMRRVGACIYEDLDTVNSLFRHHLSGQIALSLAMVRQGLEWAPLPLRFNVPNVHYFHEFYPGEVADIRVLHFLQATEIDRVADFQTVAHVERVFDRPGLAPLNVFLADRLRAVHEARILPALRLLG
jgi:hypothetical protein